MFYFRNFNFLCFFFFVFLFLFFLQLFLKLIKVKVSKGDCRNSSLIIFRIQWNLDLTKSLGTGQICSLNGGFVISRFFSIHFTVTLAGT